MEGASAGSVGSDGVFRMVRYNNLLLLCLSRKYCFCCTLRRGSSGGPARRRIIARCWASQAAHSSRLRQSGAGDQCNRRGAACHLACEKRPAFRGARTWRDCTNVLTGWMTGYRTVCRPRIGFGATMPLSTHCGHRLTVSNMLPLSLKISEGAPPHAPL
jgi:hypothetical protein